MIVRAEELRRRMTKRSSVELTEIITSGPGIYTTDAVEAARRELASRPPGTAEEDVASRVGAADRKPLAIRIALGLATVLAITSSIYVAIVLVASATGVMSIVWTPLLRQIVTAVILWWIAVGIRREHLYIPALLIAFLAASVLEDVTLAVVTREWSDLQSRIAFPVAAICYLVFAQDIAAYYRQLRASREESITHAAAG